MRQRADRLTCARTAAPTLPGGCVAALCAAPFAVIGPLAAAAQPAPKAIRLIIPQPPGGGTDLLARVLGPRLSELLGAPVVTDNRPGAGGNLGTELLAKAPADGSVLGIATAGPFTIAPSFFPDLPYNPATAFAPVMLVAQNPIVLLANATFPAADLKTLVAMARAKPGALNAAIMPGTVPHMLNELFKQATGTDFLNVPYKGGVEARNDLVSGRVQIMFSVIPPGVLDADPPRLKALAVASARRSTLAPAVPTLREAGVPDVEAGLWTGVVAPAAVPRAALERVHEALARCIARAEVREQITKLAMDIIGEGPEEFRRFMAAETAKWARIIKSAGIRPD